MPIRADLRHFYTGPAWRETRKRILDRAGHKCEQCGKPNTETVETFSDVAIMGLPVMFWRTAWSQWRDWTNIGADATISFGKKLRTIRVVLTIAHLNHVSGDDRDDNLMALCQWCHLNYDKLHHKQTRSKRKDAARPLLIQEAIL